MPLIYESFDPRALLKSFTVFSFSFFAKLLRLTSFLFGGRHEAEESGDALKVFWQVPHRDQISYQPGDTMMFPVSEEEPLRARLDRDETGDVNLYWTRVYVPKRFWTRVFSI